MSFPDVNRFAIIDVQLRTYSAKNVTHSQGKNNTNMLLVLYPNTYLH